ncbi:MAG: DUF4365 and DUF1817 domain-containing protein [Phormidium sp.]
MSSFEFPKQSKHQQIGRVGEAFFEYFTNSVLGWIYRPVPQESDFGIDGYIDLVNDGNVIGKSIAVQIKCGNSYISKKSPGGIKYEGSNKHLNYYLNLQIPIILVVISSDCSQGFWVEFDIERTNDSNSGWWIEIPKTNKLDINAKNAFVKLAGESEDFSEKIQHLWAIDRGLINTCSLIFTIPKSEVLTGSLSTLNSVIKKLTKNKEMTLNKRTSATILLSEYDSDPRELYEIPEVRSWFLKTILEGIPWFYFLAQDMEMSLTLLFCCTCSVSFKGIYGSKHSLESSPEALKWWLEHNFQNLNTFTELHGIPDEINKEISDGIFDWSMRNFSD